MERRKPAFRAKGEHCEGKKKNDAGRPYRTKNSISIRKIWGVKKENSVVLDYYRV